MKGRNEEFLSEGMCHWNKKGARIEENRKKMILIQDERAKKHKLWLGLRDTVCLLWYKLTVVTKNGIKLRDT